MKTVLYGTASALILIGGAAFAQSVDRPGHDSPAPGTRTEAMSAAKDATYGVVGKVDATMTTTTQGFVTAAANSDMYEVAAGKLAVERAQSAEVKAFAAKMVEAHTATTAKLKSLIASGKIKADAPAHVDIRRQSMLDHLRGAKAADFDHRYISQQLAAHQEADILMAGYAKDGDNAAIREFARDTDKAVKMHLSMVQKLSVTDKRASK